MSSLRYTIFTQTDLVAIQGSLQSIVSAWSEKWFVTTATEPPIETVANAFEFNTVEPDPDRTLVRQRSTAACHLVYSDRALHRLYFRMTGEQLAKPIAKASDTSIETTLTTYALADLLMMALQDPSPATTENAASAIPSDAGALANLSMQKGSGTVVATIVDGDAVIHLYLSQDAARRLCGKSALSASLPAKLTPRSAVIGSGKLKIQVTAGEAELRLADLLELKPGNVVLLNRKPDQPFQVQTADGQHPVCKAYLGTNGNHKAVELVNQ